MRSFFRFHLPLFLAVLTLLLSLTACGGSVLYETSVGQLTFHVVGSGDRARQIVVLQGGEEVERISVKGLRKSLSGETYGLSPMDLNGDGYTDLLFLVAAGESGRRYDCYLGSADGGFALRDGFSDYLNLEFDAESGTFSSYQKTLTIDPATDDTPAFEIIREEVCEYRLTATGEVEGVAKRVLIYYEESDIYCYLVYEPDGDGGWVDVRESWITDERFEASKYPLR